MIVFLIFRILALFRIQPFRLMLRKLTWQSIRKHPTKRQIVSRIIAFIITIRKSIAKLQISSISNRLAIAHFSTKAIIVSRSMDISTDSIFYSHNTISIITGNIIGETFAFIITIATNTTQSEVSTSIVQFTSKLHIKISRL